MESSMNSQESLRQRIAELEAELEHTKKELENKNYILKYRYHHTERDEEDDALFAAILETFGANHNAKSLHTPQSTFTNLELGATAQHSNVSGTHARTNTLIRRQKDEKDEQILNEIWRKVGLNYFYLSMFFFVNFWFVGRIFWSL